MRIYHKLLIGPASTILFLLLFAAVAFLAMQTEKSALEDIYHNRFSHFETSANSTEAIAQVHSNIYRLFALYDQYDQENISKVANEQYVILDQASLTLQGLTEKIDPADSERKLLNTVIENIDTYKKNVKSSIDLAVADRKSGVAAMQTADATYDTLATSLSALVNLDTDRAKGSFDDAIHTFNQALMIAIIILIVACVVSVWVSTYMGRLIMRPLTQAVKVAKQVSIGDLTSHIEVVSNDETGELSESLKVMNANLSNIASKVRLSTDSIAVAIKEIAIGNGDLAQRTSEQASNLEETASSLEQLISTVRQNAEHSKQASQLAMGAHDIATQGGVIVGQVVVTMGLINDSSKKIVDIISVIEGIAFQTNLLALNAAVEAARAGEQGRGFAVVASEVRNLARRSADAAKEIKVLIDDSVSKADSGSKLVGDAGHTMSEIVDSVGKVSQIIAEIAAASVEQSTGIEQVNQAIEQMDMVTQQNAAMVEEASAAAAALEDQTKKLSEMVSVFKLTESKRQDFLISTEQEQTKSITQASKARAITPITRQAPTLTRPLERATKSPLRVVDSNSDWKEF